MTTAQIGRCDITHTDHTITAAVDGITVLSLYSGSYWTVGAEADLGDIVLCGCALIDFLSEQESAA